MSSTSEAQDSPPAPEAVSGASPAGEPALQAQDAVRAEPPPKPTPRAAIPRRSSGGGLGPLILGLIGGLIGALVVSVSPIHLPGSGAQSAADLKAAFDKADWPQLATRISALEQRVAAMPAGSGTATLGSRLQAAEQQLTALAGQIADLNNAAAVPGAAPSGGADMSALASGFATSFTELKGRVDALAAEVQTAQNLGTRIAALETRVPADLGAELAALAAKGDMAALDARVAKLEANTSAYDAKRAAGAIALANLARAAGSGAPFTAELDAVRLVNIDSGLADPLAPYAAKGVRPASELAAEFGEVARDALRAGRRGSGSWWDRLWASLAGLFVIRSQGARAGNSADAVLSRAEAAAHAGNLQAAIAEIARLQGPAAEAVAPWRAQAEARLALDSLLTKLSARILRDLRG